MASLSVEFCDFGSMCARTPSVFDLTWSDSMIPVDVSLEVWRAAFSNFFAINQVLAVDSIDGLLFFFCVVVECEAPAASADVLGMLLLSWHSEFGNELKGPGGGGTPLVLPRPRVT